MISITVNFPGPTECNYSGIKASVADAFAAAKLVHPTWTSMVITVVNSPKKPTE